MPTPINPNLSTSKTDHASRPGIPASQKESATEWNLLVSAVKANYERLPLRWDTDILANITLSVGQYVVFTDDVLYRVHTSYNVGSPITWDASKADVIGSIATEHFKGVYADETALTTAHPTADPGDYALVDVGAVEAQLWIWDDTDSEWVASGVTTIVPPWDNTTAGIVERSTTVEAQNIVTRTAAGSSDATNDDARAPSEKGLVEMLLSFLGTAWTWALKQTFTAAPRFNSTTASQFLKVDSNKDLESVAAATQSEMITGTNDEKPATAKSVEDKGSVKSISISNGATGSTNIDCGSKQQVKAVYNTTVTGGITITKSNDSNLEILNITIAITGSSITITFPSDVRMDRIFESGTVWNQSTKVLTVSAVGTDDLFEFSLMRIGSIFQLRYGGPARA